MQRVAKWSVCSAVLAGSAFRQFKLPWKVTESKDFNKKVLRK